MLFILILNRLVERMLPCGTPVTAQIGQPIKQVLEFSRTHFAQCLA